MVEDAQLNVWFDRGWDVYKGARQDGDYPPLNDMEAQRWWLGGFGAAWAETTAIRELERKDREGGITSVDHALIEALQGRAELLHQLCVQGGLTPSSQRLH